MPLVLSLEHDSLASLSDTDVCLIPTDVRGLAAAHRLRDSLERLRYPRVLYATPSRAACDVAGLDCVHFERASVMIYGKVPQLLLAKIYAVHKLFEAGKDVLMLDSDVAIFHPMASLWHGELARASLIVQEESPPHHLNSGMLRTQHMRANPGAAATVGWLLREWFRRVYTVAATAGCSGCDQPVLNELVHNLAADTTTFHAVALPTLDSFPSSPESRQQRTRHLDGARRLVQKVQMRARAGPAAAAAATLAASHQAQALERGGSWAVQQRPSAAKWLVLQPPGQAQLNEGLSNPSACISRRVCCAPQATSHPITFITPNPSG